MLHYYTIWKLIKKYTNRQIQPDSVNEIGIFLEKTVRFIVEESEDLLRYNGTKKSRISGDVIKAIINSHRDTLLPDKAGGIREKKKSRMQSQKENVLMETP